MHEPATDEFFECELTQADLLDSDSDFLQGLRNLGLDSDFSRSILASAEDATDTDVAAELTLALGARPESHETCGEHELEEGDQEQGTRQMLASESYKDKVSSRPKATSAAYAGGKRHFEVVQQLLALPGAGGQVVTSQSWLCRRGVRLRVILQSSPT